MSAQAQEVDPKWQEEYTSWETLVNAGRSQEVATSTVRTNYQDPSFDPGMPRAAGGFFAKIPWWGWLLGGTAVVAVGGYGLAKMPQIEPMGSSDDGEDDAASASAERMIHRAQDQLERGECANALRAAAQGQIAAVEADNGGQIKAAKRVFDASIKQCVIGTASRSRGRTQLGASPDEEASQLEAAFRAAEDGDCPRVQKHIDQAGKHGERARPQLMKQCSNAGDFAGAPARRGRGRKAPRAPRVPRAPREPGKRKTVTVTSKTVTTLNGIPRKS